MAVAAPVIMQQPTNMEQNKPIEQLSKKERWELKHQEKEIAKELATKKRHTKRITKWIVGIALVVLPIGGLVWYGITRPPIPESDIVSRNGLHWHPELTIYVKGIKLETPSNLGIGASFMNPVHTHDGSGIIHLEFQGLVRKNEITLGQFFKSWSKDMRSFGVEVKMMVNGKENTEYENYVMQDKDKIEVRYE